MTGGRRLFFFLGLVGCLVIVLLSSGRSIVTAASVYLAPDAGGKADVAVLEATGAVRPELVEVGRELFTSCRAAKVIIVMDRGAIADWSHPLPSEAQALAEKLQDMGLTRDQFRLIRVPSDHPVTLRTAKIVLSELSRDGVRSAILVSEGFHTRRSYWAYKQVGEPLGITIIPHPYYFRYSRDNWWKESAGIYAFGLHVGKLLYYVARGYIPLRSLWAM